MSMDEVVISPAEVVRYKRTRFNPMRQLTPERLTVALDSFEAGSLRDAALLWEAIAEREPTIKNVKEKREKATSKRDWEILKLEDSEEADRQAAILKAFYNGVETVNAYDKNQRGGVRLLIRQMMQAVSYRYATHNIIWNVTDGVLGAVFQFLPLHCFENTTGELRFIGSDYRSEGEPLTQGSWMVTVGDGLMMACSITYMYKRLALHDLVGYSEKFGKPGVLGKSSAAPDSKEGRAFLDAVQRFGNEWNAVIFGTDNADIQLIEAKGAGSIPMPDLIERMERAMVSLYRGADLSTMSRESASSGVTVQSEEMDLLGSDDAMMVSETLNYYIDRQVLRYYEVRNPLAYFKLLVPEQEDVSQNIKVDDALIRWGVRISKAALAQRYGRAEAADGEEVAQLPQGGSVVGAKEVVAANSRPLEDDPDIGVFLAAARDRYAGAAAADLHPLSKAIAKVLQLHGAEFETGLKALERELPAIAGRVFKPGQAEETLVEILGTALVAGMATDDNQ